jgi:hypothetical protein
MGFNNKIILCFSHQFICTKSLIEAKRFFKTFDLKRLDKEKPYHRISNFSKSGNWVDLTWNKLKNPLTVRIIRTKSGKLFIFNKEAVIKGIILNIIVFLCNLFDTNLI